MQKFRHRDSKESLFFLAKKTRMASRAGFAQCPTHTSHERGAHDTRASHRCREKKKRKEKTTKPSQAFRCPPSRRPQHTGPQCASHRGMKKWWRKNGNPSFFSFRRLAQRSCSPCEGRRRRMKPLQGFRRAIEKEKERKSVFLLSLLSLLSLRLHALADPLADPWSPRAQAGRGRKRRTRYGGPLAFSLAFPQNRSFRMRMRMWFDDNLAGDGKRSFKDGS